MSKYNTNRRNEIEKIVQEKKNVTIRELAFTFKVTTETIRNDLAFLEKKGVLARVHGGAVFQIISEEPSMESRKMDRTQIKKELARSALDFIQDGALIYIDNASTSLFLAKLLNLKRNCTIVTNSIELVNALSESKHDIILLGGNVSKKGKRIYGDYALKIAQTFHFDVCVLGMDGCKSTKAPANMNMDEVMLNDTILSHSTFSILISDGSKFEQDARYIFADFNEFDCLITTKIPNHFRPYVSTKTIIEIGEEYEQN